LSRFTNFCAKYGTIYIGQGTDGKKLKNKRQRKANFYKTKHFRLNLVAKGPKSVAKRDQSGVIFGNVLEQHLNILLLFSPVTSIPIPPNIKQHIDNFPALQMRAFCKIL